MRPPLTTPIGPRVGYAAVQSNVYLLHDEYRKRGVPFRSFRSTTPLVGLCADHQVSPFPRSPLPATNPRSSATFTTRVYPVWHRPELQDGRTYSWNTSIEHSFGENWLIKAAYVASESVHQNYLNEADLGLPICGPVSSTCAPVTSNPLYQPALHQRDERLLGRDCELPIRPVHPGPPVCPRPAVRGKLYLLTHHQLVDSDTTAFNGAIDDPRCPRCDRGNSSADIPNVFVANFVYETPALAGWNKGCTASAGWMANQRHLPGAVGTSLVRRHSLGADNVLAGLDGSDLADYASGVTTLRVHPGNLYHYLDASQYVHARNRGAWATPAGIQLGRSALASIPGILGISKNFHITERYRFQLRWETFNALNRVTFSGPNNNISSSNFGQITSTNGGYPSRVMQFAGKFYF